MPPCVPRQRRKTQAFPFPASEQAIEEQQKITNYYYSPMNIIIKYIATVSVVLTLLLFKIQADNGLTPCAHEYIYSMCMYVCIIISMCVYGCMYVCECVKNT